jgi:hypothetical protein
MKTVGRPERAYQAQATRGLASGQTMIRVAPWGLKGVFAPISTAHSQGARDAQFGRIAPGTTGSQVSPFGR